MNLPITAPVHQLGERRFPTPLLAKHREIIHRRFIDDTMAVPLHIVQREGAGDPVTFEAAGPRSSLFFDPAATHAAVVTCGGLCPGLNNVIRSLYLELLYHYGVPRVSGIRYGYHGLNKANGAPPVALTPETVSDIHERGGSILGVSRGPQPAEMMVDYLRELEVNAIFVIGGDGTQRGAMAIDQEARRQGYPLAVVGIPKTIDNDIHYVSRTFGFNTAVTGARAVIESAHTEAHGAFNGVGIVKVMGRDSGFIAAAATLASGHVNYCLIPEIPFAMDGPKGLLRVLEARLARRGHAVIVVAEGAGQDLIPRDRAERDASGNVKHADIGVFLCNRIRGHFAELRVPVNVRYIDPSYFIRSTAANTEDAILCDQLARHAVHAAMAGKTGLIIGSMHQLYAHVPMRMAVQDRKTVMEHGDLWSAVLSSTGQPVSLMNEE